MQSGVMKHFCARIVRHGAITHNCFWASRRVGVPSDAKLWISSTLPFAESHSRYAVNVRMSREGQRMLRSWWLTMLLSLITCQNHAQPPLASIGLGHAMLYKSSSSSVVPLRRPQQTAMDSSGVVVGHLGRNL